MAKQDKAVTLNKFCKIYVSGFDGAKELRDRLMHCKDIAELHEQVVLSSRL